MILQPGVVPCGLSSLSSRIHSCLFANYRRTVSSKFFDTKVPSVCTEELVLPCHACCAPLCPRCHGHSLLLAKSRILYAAFVFIQPGMLLIPFCAVQPRTLCDARSRSNFSLSPQVHALGSFLASGDPWSSAKLQCLGKSR